MITTGSNNIDEILARSQKLTSHGADKGLAPANIYRGVAELSEAAKQWARPDLGTDQNTFEAFRMLSNKNFDAKKYIEEVNSIHVKTSDDAAAVRLEGTDIEGYLAHQHDMIILAAIDDARVSADSHVQEMQRRWSANEWANARSQFMESLGHRAYRWEGMGDPRDPYSGATTLAVGALAGFTPQTEVLRKKQGLLLSPMGVSSSGLKYPRIANTGMLDATPVAGGRSVVNMSGLMSMSTPGTAQRLPGGGMGSSREYRKPPVSDLLRAHNDVVRSLNMASHAANVALQLPRATEEVRPYNRLAESIRIPSVGAGAGAGSTPGTGAVMSDGMNAADLAAYQIHLQLLACAVGEVQPSGLSHSSAGGFGAQQQQYIPAGASGPPPAGYFSAICFDPADITSSTAVVESRRQLITGGIKSYFEAQVWEVWSSLLDEAAFAGYWELGESAEGASRKQRLRSYCAYLWQQGRLPRSCGRVMCAAAAGGRGAPLALGPSGSAARAAAAGSAGSSNALVVSDAVAAGNRHRPTPLWVFVYHCLRVGDLEAAVSELDCSIAQGGDDGGAAAFTIIKHLLVAQSSGGADGGATGAGRSSARRAGAGAAAAGDSTDWRQLQDALQSCKAQYEAEVSSDESFFDPFRTLVFNLLGLVDRDSLASSALPGFSLEDFLWAQLWFIQQMRVLKPALDGRGFISDASSPHGGTKVHTIRESDLFELIMEYGGADYFDPERSSPFRYAMVLCCCQRFGDAIAHLWQCNKVLPAVHLVSVALHYGLVLPHVPLCCNPPHPMVMGSKFLGGGNVGLSQEPTPAAILQFFAQTPLLQHYPAVAADYLVSLDSRWLSYCQQGLVGDMKETHKLKAMKTVNSVLEAFLSSLDREQLGEVVGFPIDDATGGDGAGAGGGTGAGSRGVNRTPGARLESYFSSADVDLLLARVAYKQATSHVAAEPSIYLYQLAGRYGDMLDELCSQLCNVLIPRHEQQQLDGGRAGVGMAGGTSTRQAAERSHWRDIAGRVISQYILRGGDSAAVGGSRGEGSSSSSSSAMAYALARDGKQDLVNSLMLLAKLFAFVDAVCGSDSDCGGEAGFTRAGTPAALAAGRMNALQCLELLDQLQVLPSRPDQVEAFTAVDDYLKRVLDDLLILSMECTTRAFLQLKQERAALPPNPQSAASAGAGAGTGGGYYGLLTDKDTRMQALQLRAEALVVFANRVKARLNRLDTPGLLARMEAAIAHK